MSGTKAVPPADRSIVRVRHDLRLRLLTVVSVVRVTPRMMRVTIGGEPLRGFVSAGFDDHVKVFFPSAGETFDRVPELGSTGPIFDGTIPVPVMRDFTPHHFDEIALTLQLDFAIHDGGPATAWALGARPGDQLIIGGPRGPFVVGTGFEYHLLIGDETALPAIRRRLAELPAGGRAVVFAEIEGFDDEESFSSLADIEIHWIHRTRSTLVDAIAKTSLPDGPCYAWIACESSGAKALRAELLRRGFDRSFMKAAGYWRRGMAAAHDIHE